MKSLLTLMRYVSHIEFLYIECSLHFNISCLTVCFAAYGQGVLQRHRENQNYWQYIYGSCRACPHHWHQGSYLSFFFLGWVGVKHCCCEKLVFQLP